MRSFIGGLLGLCLGLAAMPQGASARTDARAAVQTTNPSRAAVASRPTNVRPGAPRSAVAPASAARPQAGRVNSTRLPSAGRSVAARPVAGPAVAGRPVVDRTVAGRAAMANSRAGLSTRGTASSHRQAMTSRAVTRSGNSRHAVAVPYSRHAATLSPRQLRQTAMMSCSTRQGRRVCAPAVTRTASMRWTGGLAPAAMSQAGCPDGTIATMAIGHNDITRCVPL